jgi:hypothetical protein
MKLRPLGGELFHADRRTDMTKLIVAFRNFAYAPKTGCTVAEGISCRSLTAETWVQSQASPCGIYGGITSTGMGIPLSTSASHPQYNSASDP